MTQWLDGDPSSKGDGNSRLATDKGKGFAMKAAVLASTGKVLGQPLRIEEVSRPEPAPGQVLLRVLACGVCRTDLHIVEGELSPLRERLIPGHQIVGEIVEGATSGLALGTRVGVSWIGGTDGTCWYCKNNLENLCDSPTFTGYSVNGGYAEFAAARSDFVFPLPAALDLHAAPLLCAGIIGFRSLRVAGVEPEKESACSALVRPHIWPSQFFAPGSAMFMSQPEARRIAGWPNPWEPSGLVRKRTSLRWNLIAPSPSPRAGTWSSWHSPVCERVAWLPSTRSISIAFLSSTTTACSGESGKYAASPT